MLLTFFFPTFCDFEVVYHEYSYIFCYVNHVVVAGTYPWVARKSLAKLDQKVLSWLAEYDDVIRDSLFNPKSTTGLETSLHLAKSNTHVEWFWITLLSTKSVQQCCYEIMAMTYSFGCLHTFCIKPVLVLQVKRFEKFLRVLPAVRSPIIELGKVFTVLLISFLLHVSGRSRKIYRTWRRRHPSNRYLACRIKCRHQLSSIKNESLCEEKRRSCFLYKVLIPAWQV